MHTMSKLSTIAASATLLAALSAFGAASDNPITSDNEKFFAAIDLSAAEGGSKPRLKSGSETKDVTVETGDTDPDSGDSITETVEKTIYYIEATFGDGFSIIIR